MADYNNSNSNGFSNSRKTSDDDVNTNGIMLRNYDQRKFLTCSFWNKAVTIEIGTIPEGAESDFTVMRRVQTIKQVMSFSTLTTLESICEDVLSSIKKTGQFAPVGAPCGAKFNNMIEISDGSNLGLNKGIYLVIYKDWDANRMTNRMDVYPFSVRTVIRGYDHNTGRCTEDIDKVRDFKDFYLWVREACKAFTYAQAHTVMEVSKKERKSSSKMLFAISASLGIDVGADVLQPVSRSKSQSTASGGYKKSRFDGGNYEHRGNYRNSSTGYRGGSTGGYPRRQSDGGYQSGNQGVNLDLNVQNVSDLPIDEFV